MSGKERVKGFVGWAGKLNTPLFKMYVSYIPWDYVVNSYGAYGSAMGLEAITLHPKREGETVKDIFFKTKRPFSHHHGYEEFGVSSTPVDCELLDFLNFATNTDDEIPEDRKRNQHLFLKEFIGSYKGLESGRDMSVGDPHPGTTHLEPLDKSHFTHLSLAYCNDNTTIYEEVEISGSGSVPHGTIDLVALSETEGSVMPPMVPQKLVPPDQVWRHGWSPWPQMVPLSKIIQARS